MSLFWRRVADYTQRGLSITLAGLTVLGLVILAQEGHGVVHRYKQGKALKSSTAQAASQDNQVRYSTVATHRNRDYAYFPLFPLVQHRHQTIALKPPMKRAETANYVYHVISSLLCNMSVIIILAKK